MHEQQSDHLAPPNKVVDLVAALEQSLARAKVDREKRACSGDTGCPAKAHIHGCYSDTGNCDAPDEHRAHGHRLGASGA